MERIHQPSKRDIHNGLAANLRTTSKMRASKAESRGERKLWQSHVADWAQKRAKTPYVTSKPDQVSDSFSLTDEISKLAHTLSESFKGALQRFMDSRKQKLRSQGRGRTQTPASASYKAPVKADVPGSGRTNVPAEDALH